VRYCVLIILFSHGSLYGMNVTGLRFFTVYGPRGRPDMAPFKFVDRVSKVRSRVRRIHSHSEAKLNSSLCRGAGSGDSAVR
jgi:nucleoside-diphosphate-sugar epimerase